MEEKSRELIARPQLDRTSRVWNHPLLQLTLARTRESLREPAVAFSTFIFIMPLLFALGIAFRNTAPEKIRVAVESSAPPQFVEALAASANLQPIMLSPEDAARALRSGKVALVVRVAKGDRSSETSNQGKRRDAEQNTAGENQNKEVQAAAAPLSGINRSGLDISYSYDPARPESLTARFAVDDVLQRAMGRVDVLSAQERTVSEPGARYIDFLVPGLIGVNLMGSGLYGFGYVIVQARTRKLLKRLAATPMRRSHYLLSFLLSRLTFLVIEVILIIGFTRIMFDVAVHGSLLALAAVALTGAMSFAGIGLLVAARPKTIEGVAALMNFVMLPMWLLSGSFFSSSRFPEFLQPAIRLLPLTALNDSLRAIMNDGAPFASTWPQICVMLMWGVISFLLALRFFRWQ